MKKLTTLLMTLMLMCTALWADETITVSANSSDISEGLDLKVVAKLFADAKNLEEFETMLNNPDSAFCNLDLNGDGQVDYLRVVETGEGNKRLIVLQAILAKDIYQDVASIYVEKDAADNVSVQVIGDEYVYGANYIIEPVYVYRPIIYDWFWGPYWYAWESPWYWGYYPGWWYVHRCWAHDWYWRHCYAYHHCHHYCSFRAGRAIHSGYHELHSGVTRREYAMANPERSFSQRNAGMSNAREIRNTTGVRARQSSAAVGGGGAARSASTGQRTELGSGVGQRTDAASRTYGSTHTAVARSQSTTRTQGAARSDAGRGEATARTQSSVSRSQGTTATASRSEAASRSTSVTTTRSTGNTASTRSTSASTSSSSASTRTTSATTTRSTATRSTGSTATTRSTSTATRSTSSTSRSTSAPARSSSSTYSSSRSSSGSGASTRSSGSYGGGSYGGSRSSGGGYSGGGSRGGGASSGGGGGRTRR